LVVIGALQTVGYALFCGFFGYILAEKIGLWKPIKFEKKEPRGVAFFLTVAFGFCSAGFAASTELYMQ